MKPYTTDSLPKMAYEVREDLDQVFSFGDHAVSAEVFDIRDQKSQEILNAIHRAYGVSQNDSEREIKLLLNKSIRGTCSYTATVTSGKYDYMAFVSDVSPETTVVLGEEMTHGEHQTYHSRRDPDYTKNFHEPAIEFLGLLGLLVIADKVGGVRATIGKMDINENGASQHDIDHYIGYFVAKQIYDKGNVPHAGLFHEENQEALWRRVNDIIRPSISMRVPRRYMDIVESQIRKTLELTCMDADVRITRKI